MDTIVAYLRRNTALVTRYEDDLRLFPTRMLRFGMLVLFVVWLFAPYQLDDFWLNVLNFAGVAAIGALGLMLLTGFTGQVSLGHAFFLACGAYAAATFGGRLEWPLLLWLPAAAIVGGLIGGLIGPFALRLRGQYLVIVTIGLLFVGDYIFMNWTWLTGGGAGTAVDASLAVGPLDFANLELFGQTFSRDQGVFWLVWFLVALATLLTKNIVRTRPGRALQAVRDRDIAAEVIGISLARYKIGAFVVSSALAAVAGGLYGAALQQYVSPSEFGIPAGLFLSIQYVAIIIVGGLGTVFGAIIGALFIGALPRIIDELSKNAPLLSAILSTGPTDEGLMSVFAFNQLVFGALIVLFLVLEPRGLAAIWIRLKLYLKAWPFSY